MKNVRILVILMIVVCLMLPSQLVTAAPQLQIATPITGTVTDVVINLNTTTTGVPTVSVTLTDSLGVTQTVVITLDAAVTLGLVTVDTAGNITKNPIDPTKPITIEPTMLPPTTDTTTPKNPVAEAIADFFDLDYDTVMGFHEDGVGFGVIAQACFMSFQLTGDASLCGDIIDAKKSGDFSNIVLPDGTTASNWGQFKKAVSDHKNPHATLGGIMSGKANQGESTGTDFSIKSKGKSNNAIDKNKNKDKSVGPGNSNSGNNGNNGNNGGNNGNNGNDQEKGKDKDKDKGKGKNK